MLTRILSIMSIAFITETQANTPKTADTPTVAGEKVKQEDLDVVIYTSKGCTYCTSVKELFAEQNIPFTEKNVDNNRILFKELEDKNRKKDRSPDFD